MPGRRPRRGAPRRTPPVLLTAGLLGGVLSGCGTGDTPATSSGSTGAAAAATPSSAPATSAASGAAASTAGSTAGRGAPIGVFEVTCHTGPGVTASGRPSSREIVSVDRRLFPFGTRLYIDQVGVRVAADTGPAMVGRRLDIWEPSAAACTAFGRKRLVVWRAP